MSLSSLRSLVLFSKRVCAESMGFFHLLCVVLLKGPNGNGVFVAGESLICRMPNLKLSNIRISENVSALC